MRAICVCVPEDPKAIESAKEHFEASGLDNVEFLWCINAQIAGLATWHTYERDHPGSGFKMGTKPTGIWLAHWTAWTVGMRYSEDHLMILETDAKFEDGWKDKMGQALQDAPNNFDFLHIGHCCMEGHERKNVKGNVYESKAMQCTHAYIVRRSVLPFILSRLRKIWAPIDIQLQLECFPDLLTYAVIPRLVSQWNTILAP
jgi:GR25 family glycosyltransferase involved in LPS biosynthesis